MYADISSSGANPNSSIVIYDNYPTNNSLVTSASGDNPITPKITLVAGKTYYLGMTADVI